MCVEVAATRSTIAVGSGQVIGKGVGYERSQNCSFCLSIKQFYFRCFAEEWGNVGVILLFIIYGIVFWRMLKISFYGGSNFEILYGVGLTLLFIIHAVIHIGMNIGLLPVTGNTLPFMSYGGSHLMTEFFGLGMLMGMRKSSRTVHKDLTRNELVI
jgi:rod shape determining protein RodA